jgi:capsular exopolysaccharide synthesis family protein
MIGRRKWIIILSILLATGIAAIITFLSEPQYTASTTVRVATVGSVSSDARPDINYTERLLNTYARILTGPTARRQLMDELGLAQMPILNVQTVPGTELMRITAEAPDPEEARDSANGAAQLLIDQNQEYYTGGAGQTLQQILGEQLTAAEQELAQSRADYEQLLRDTPENAVAIAAASQALEVRERSYATLLGQYESARLEEAVRANAISVVEPAVSPSRPSKPRHPVNIALGLAIGIIGGAALAFLLDNLDTTLYTPEQIESATQLATVGKIPAARDEMQIARISSGHYPQLESFRRLRTNILASNDMSTSQVVLLTSARRGEGKSTVSANLGVTIAQSGREVILVDCDLRLPTLHKFFDLPNKRGLTNILTGELTFRDAIQYTAYPRVQVITSGSLPPNPTELLGSQQMMDLIAQLRAEYDFVILDTPALLSVADAAVLAPAADNVILVVAQGETRRGDVETVREQLSNVRVKSIEVVINNAEPNGSYAYYEAESR